MFDMRLTVADEAKGKISESSSTDNNLKLKIPDNAKFNFDLSFGKN